MPEHPEHLLIIFLKEPIEGKVKTRIGKTAGHEKAVQIYKSLVKTLLSQLAWVPDTHYRFCFAPADAEEAIKYWLLPDLNHRIDGGQVLPLDENTPKVDFIPQVNGDLGDRLEAAFKDGFDQGYKTVTAIGADCPFLSARWIQTALISGKDHDVTIGPTPDGGYYLISLNQFTSVPFRQIPWSEDDTFNVTLQKLNNAGLTTHQLPELGDIDFEEDWNKALNSPLGPRLKKNILE